MYLDLFSEESRQSLHFGRLDCISIDAFLAMSGPLNVNFFLGEHTPGSQIRAPLSTLLRGLWLSTLASSISNAVPHPWKHLQYGYPVLYRQFQNHDLAWRTGAICSQKASARQAKGLPLWCLSQAPHSALPFAHLKNTNEQLLCLFCRLIMTALGSKNS